MRKILITMAALMPMISVAADFVPTKFSLLHVASGVAEDEPATIISALSLDLSTDKACYNPGDQVRFTASEMPGDARIRYRHGADVVEDAGATGTFWTWTPPAEDYKGYLVEVYRKAPGNLEIILGSIAVDVSSDWTKFPRYGFVATFDASKLKAGVIEGEMDYLNRCHINGVQFQDWHYKHHQPLGGTREKPYALWQDIAWRDVYMSTVKKYIDIQHSYGMKSMFYNLCYGATKDAAKDGVDESWYIFTDPDHQNKDRHSLPESWKSDIFLLDPGSQPWQQYIAQRNDDVYYNFDFDGYQIDQLGWRGDHVYNYYGGEVDLSWTYRLFINAMKDAHPDKRLVMNSIGDFGADNIIGSGKVDFAYNECWAPEKNFSDLRNLIAKNDGNTPNPEGIRTVFAAYMNYDLAGRTYTGGYLNTPGILLTDAVIMAIGGSHLELGDHMLCREYFPASPLVMSDELRAEMIRYYDFMTAYENLLRGTDTSSEVAAGVYSDNFTTQNWPPRRGTVTTYARNVEGKRVCHLLNFINANSISWRDLEGDMPAPRELEQIPVRINVGDRQVSRIWTASPDYHGGAVQELKFNLSAGYAYVTLPALKYWTMIVVE